MPFPRECPRDSPSKLMAETEDDQHFSKGAELRSAPMERLVVYDFSFTDSGR